MRSIIFILTISLSVISSAACKSKKEASSSTPTASFVKGVHTGKVSHQYRSGGCATVIVIPAAGEDAAITLIPKDKLSKEFDVDGLEIFFDYHPLKMAQPAGCSVGIPAEITNVAKLK